MVEEVSEGGPNEVTELAELIVDDPLRRLAATPPPSGEEL